MIQLLIFSVLNLMDYHLRVKGVLAFYKCTTPLPISYLLELLSLK